MKLSNFELEVMRHIWQEGSAIAPDVHRKIERYRPISYSAVKSIFDRLEQKGAIYRVRTYGRTILYAPHISEADYVRPVLRDFVNRVFHGDLNAFFSMVLCDPRLTAEDLSALEAALAKKRRAVRGGP